MRKHPKVSVIVTVMNEVRTIVALLDALAAQTLSPSEVVITDGGSTDGTLDEVRRYLDAHPTLRFQMRVSTVKGNRSQGRNAAIQLAESELIAITDAGCVPAPGWLAELLRAYQAAEDPATVVAGYALGKPDTPFQHAVIPYFLVMPDRISPQQYLPATRSMLVTKQSWASAGKFPDQFNTSEDYIFARQLRKKNIPITFAQQAVVYWQPPSTVIQTAKTFAILAASDARAGILRPKVIMLFARYVLGVVAVGLLVQRLNIAAVFSLVLFGLAAYLCWSISKNMNYVQGAWYWLPVLQLAADVSVITGTVIGVFQRTYDRGSSDA